MLMTCSLLMPGLVSATSHAGRHVTYVLRPCRDEQQIALVQPAAATCMATRCSLCWYLASPLICHDSAAVTTYDGIWMQGLVRDRRACGVQQPAGAGDLQKVGSR